MKKLLLIIFSFSFLFTACKKDKDPALATVTTGLPIASEITNTSAILYGSVVKEGNVTVTEKGIVIGTTYNPTILSPANTILGGGSGKGDFSVNATDLLSGTNYYYRAYAINSEGTAYGQNQSFSTKGNASISILCGDSFTLDCLDQNWTIQKSATASYSILPNFYKGKNCLFLFNPHASTQANPPSIIFNTIIKNIKPNTPYQISCDVKIEGYPDYLNNPAFAFYAYTNDKWYGEHYYGSAPGVWESSPWSEHSYSFISGSETALKFQLYSLYDSLWITNLRIKEL